MTPISHSQESAPFLQCLVIQLSQLEDTLQSLIALKSAKKFYPQLQIHFLVREEYAFAVKKAPWIEKVIPLSTKALFYPSHEEETEKVEKLAVLAKWIAPLIKDPWDFLINWTFSDASSYLSALIPTKIRLGVTRKKNAHFSITDGWSHYFIGIIQSKIPQDIHLIDLLTTQLLTALQIHLGEPFTAKKEIKLFFSDKKNNHFQSESHFENPIKWICIEYQTSLDSKYWPPQKWAEFTATILNKNSNYGIYLLSNQRNTESEKLFFKEFLLKIENQKRKNMLIQIQLNESNFDSRISILSQCEWVITEKTTTMHLGSLLGKRILTFSSEDSRFQEKGPYGNGHYILTSTLNLTQDPAFFAQKISAKFLYNVWSYASQEYIHHRKISLKETLKQMKCEENKEFITIFRSRIRPSQNGGGVTFEALTETNLSLEQWTSLVIGQIARLWYCGWNSPIGNGLENEKLTPMFIQNLRELGNSSEILSKICNQSSTILFALVQKIATLKSEKIMEIKDHEQLQSLISTLAELDQLIERVSKKHWPLMAFSQMNKILMHPLRKNRLADLNKKTLESHYELCEGILLFKQWIDYTLNLAKPKIVLLASERSFKDPSNPSRIEPILC